MIRGYKGRISLCPNSEFPESGKPVDRPRLRSRHLLSISWYACTAETSSSLVLLSVTRSRSAARVLPRSTTTYRRPNDDLASEIPNTPSGNRAARPRSRVMKHRIFIPQREPPSNLKKRNGVGIIQPNSRRPLSLDIALLVAFCWQG